MDMQNKPGRLDLIAIMTYGAKIKSDVFVKSNLTDGTVKSSRCKARES